MSLAILSAPAWASAVLMDDVEKPESESKVPEAGPFEIELVERTLRDEARTKDLPLVVVYPEAGEGPFPVIIFSHGAGGSGRFVTPLPRFWASHGYVCIAPTHAESLSLRLQTGQGQNEDDPNPVEMALNSPELWADRTRDISFVIDSLGKLAEEIPGLKGRIDPEKIGVGGHSLGAFTTQLIGGVTIKPRGEKESKSFADDRAQAFLLLSGQGTGQMGLNERSWDNFQRPLMGITGTLDRGAGGQGHDWRGEPFQYAPEGDKYHIVIEGAHHGSFTGRTAEQGANANAANRLGRPAQRRLEQRLADVPPERREALRKRLMERLGNPRRNAAGASADPVAIFAEVQNLSLAFWNAYLKNDDQAKAFLQSQGDHPPATGQVQRTFQHK